MKTIKLISLYIVLCATLLQSSCKKILEIDPPSNSLVPATVFKSNEVATSAILGIYSVMALSGFASGDSGSISSLCGLTADEFIGYNPNLLPFYNNQIPADNSALTALWLSIYQRIYTANSILEGLKDADNISLATKNELQGEALFIRAFCYFYLVNLFGDVPLHLSTNLQINSQTSRMQSAEVYKQIVADLKSAEDLLSENYITVERIRPNKATANALLARVYLYLQDWTNAEFYSTKVIDRTSLYSLVALNDIFLKNSSEAIWQLMPTANSNTNDGNLLILTTTPSLVSLNGNLATSVFEVSDKRKDSWIRSITNATGTFYYPYKYKVKSSATVTEYSMVIRLAELYLIRAEARANLNKLAISIGDLDKIRSRAGLPLIADTDPTINQTELLKAIVKERRIELFSEWGHRWLDLNRTRNADLILRPIKSNWQSTDTLFPISKDEITRNLNIIQNDGY
ncbi:RagB/SusD family nutrient uptake outer membrane protein [Pedobacter nutrimenti]|uniref:SusD-like starch-binding protein associating with outer membrane n=1 Tax=Pedobacter nutrimenti TaxID=1241337 RepID=A0A318UEQ3_9SPHI|nr:RagB/SusD family nutrient uptake outer membrane protein [Pedobacter nutrimenti]PYF74563.1 SusD-like starch-binding protein associating with outer membrane [Pedobacter nutrimenti]